MSAWVIAPSGLIEPVPAPIIVVKDIGAMELLDDGTFCSHFYWENLSIEAPEAPPQKQVVLKVISPLSTIPGRICALAQCLMKQSPPVIAHYSGPRLVP